MKPEDILVPIATSLGLELLSHVRLGGGDVAMAYRVVTKDKVLFVKLSQNTAFEAEVKGLDLLRATGCVRIPKVLDHGRWERWSFMVLEYIPVVSTTSAGMQALGRALACLHTQEPPACGLDHDNFIGRLVQYNGWKDKWPEFYVEKRLLPQFEMAVENKRWGAELNADQIFYRCETFLKDRRIGLCHGDLWSGNVLEDVHGNTWLIDPAVYYGDGETDLAMSRLFGGFGSDFYRAYDEILPSEAGWQERQDVYQLYYLLVHLNMFGMSYLPAVNAIFRRYFL